MTSLERFDWQLMVDRTCVSMADSVGGVGGVGSVD